MSEFVQSEVRGRIGCITLDRPKALNSLSLAMVRALHAQLQAWRDEVNIAAVLIKSSSEKGYCAGGDIRFFYDAGRATPTGGSALLEDFFTEEYALNHLIHFYPKPYIALLDGVVMGGGMGIAQAGPQARMRVVTERTRMAMPEVNIGLFPDVGGSYFLSHLAGEFGAYLGLSGETISAADAIHVQLADVFVPGAELPALVEAICHSEASDLRETVRQFAAPFAAQADAASSRLAQNEALIQRHFAHDDVAAICRSLESDADSFAQKTLAAMQKRSPLMMCVTLAQLRRGKAMSVAQCLRMERTLVRHNFTHGEVLEGVRALVIDKDNAPVWNPPTLAQVTTEMVESFFAPVWPDYAHPLAALA
ncbi:MAG: enoyl-CoA hydratase/isomerase family protein [Burkholderiales bacterium]|nr:enoyl-CoA hydratase/isomerase family protein [Burkholderiales bacterium]